MMHWLAGGLALAALVVVGTLSAVHGQGPGHQHGTPAAEPAPSASKPAADRAPRRITMEELHHGGGVPAGWKFTVPPGNADRGREVFRQLECYKCHEIKGQDFPAAGTEAKSGPELTGMGSFHPAEYVAESILAPNHVIVEGPGFTGPDGLSTMPSYTDSLSLTQWLDLVAYLKSLTASGAHAAHAPRETRAGSYRVRLVYAGGHDSHDGGHAGHGGHSGHAGHGTPASRGHLMAFITDGDSDEAVPYLPVTATVVATGRPPLTVRLAPMLGEHGFHYGTDVALPERTQKITLAIGAATVAVTGSDKTRFKRPVKAVFDWAAP